MRAICFIQRTVGRGACATFLLAVLLTLCLLTGRHRRRIIEHLYSALAHGIVRSFLLHLRHTAGACAEDSTRQRCWAMRRPVSQALAAGTLGRLATPLWRHFPNERISTMAAVN